MTAPNVLGVELIVGVLAVVIGLAIFALWTEFQTRSRMKREDALGALRVAGYHDDGHSFARIYVENRISHKVARQEWSRGVALKRAGVGCTCFECKRNAP